MLALNTCSHVVVDNDESVSVPDGPHTLICLYHTEIMESGDIYL